MSESFNSPDQGDSNEQGSSDQKPTFSYKGRELTEEDVQKKFSNADDHISEIERENREHRETISKLVERVEGLESQGKSMEDLVKRLDERDNAGNGESQEQDHTVDVDSITDRAAEEAFNRMTAREQQKQFEANFNQVSQEVRELYGDKSDEVVKQVGSESGYSFEEMCELAARKPKAFRKLAGLTGDNSSKPSPSMSDSDVRSPSDGNSQQDKPADVIGAKNTSESIKAWNSRLEAKLKELGIEN